MDDNRLGNLRSDISQLPDDEAGFSHPQSQHAMADTAALSGSAQSSPDFQAFAFHQEANTLKIEKLANRVTIISVIIPCLIIAVLGFAYLDMKERVVDVDETKKVQVAEMGKRVEAKLNALDVRIAKNRFDLDKAVPDMKARDQALENQMAKLTASKADLNSMESALAKLSKQIQANSGQDKATVKAMEKLNKQLLAAIKANTDQVGKTATRIKEEMQLFKEEFDARLLELSDYDQQIAQLGKKISLMDKGFKTLEQDTAGMIGLRTDQVRLSLEKLVKDLDHKIQKQLNAMAARPAAPKPGDGPRPQLDAGPAGTISEQTLTQ